MKRAFILVPVLLTACGYDSVTPKAFELATSWCAHHGGLSLVRRDVRDREYVRLTAFCENGAEVTRVVSRTEPGV